ncbi:hypothetical protein [Microbulbifer pacificus]|uniref:hypothetical protein n=1 Tax=Microbulbifer pacificus TaxID=407164 RepID=UPI000CF4EC4D|nr:hypothetical protein [Microbulbifer pacificus]
MKYLVFSFLAIFSSIVFAETASDRAQVYFNDLAEGRYAQAAEHFDPKQLREFRELMSFYTVLPENERSQFINSFFGENETEESVKNKSDVEFFAGLFSFIMLRAEAAGGINFDGMEILGEVKEGDDTSHLVTRNKVSVGEVNLEAMEVVSLRRIDKHWKVMLSGKLKGLPQQLEKAYSK